MNLNTTLPAPERSVNLPSSAQWLAGEGAGSWFYIIPKNKCYFISRYSPTGKLECESIFELSKKGFDISKPYTFTHLSHCQQVHIKQNGNVFQFIRTIE